MTSPLRAAAWMLGAVVSFTLMAIAGRQLSIHLDTFEIMMYRSLIGVFIVIAAGGLAGSLGQITRRQMGLHIARNACHFAGQNLWFYALTLIPLVQVFALEFSSPIWVLLAAPLFLGERLTGMRAFSAALGFIGILVVTRPDFNGISPGILAAFLSAFGFAGSILFTKLLTRGQTITCILFWMTVIQAVFGIACAGYDGDIAWPLFAHWPWVILVAAAGVFAHFCVTTALSLAPATLVAPVDFFRLPVIAAVGSWLYLEPLDPFVLAGAVLILAANYLNVWTEAQNTARKTAGTNPP